MQRIILEEEKEITGNKAEAYLGCKWLVQITMTKRCIPYRAYRDQLQQIYSIQYLLRTRVGLLASIQAAQPLDMHKWFHRKHRRAQ